MQYDKRVSRHFQFGAVSPFESYENNTHVSIWTHDNKWCIVHHDSEGYDASGVDEDDVKREYPHVYRKMNRM